MRLRKLFALSVLLLLLPAAAPAGTLGQPQAEEASSASGVRSANIMLGGGGAFLHLRDVFATLLHFHAPTGSHPGNPFAALLQLFFHRSAPPTPPTPPVPEPGTFGLLALGLAGLAAGGRRRRAAG